jgi:uncharacterized protein YqgV (UPF0045/DUF77 family)
VASDGAADASRDARIEVEFFVEPFREGEPGEHVRAAIEAFEARGLVVEVGPFGSTTGGDASTTVGGIADMVTAALSAGAQRIQIQVRAT